MEKSDGAEDGKATFQPSNIGKTFMESATFLVAYDIISGVSLCISCIHIQIFFPIFFEQERKISDNIPNAPGGTEI